MGCPLVGLFAEALVDVERALPLPQGHAAVPLTEARWADLQS